MTQASPTVLTVDDEQALTELYTHWLEADGCTVLAANSGSEALDHLSEDVDVVLLDRQMPGLSGDEALEAIRAAGYDCRVAMVTGVDPEFDVIEMGFDAYLVKPVTKGDVQETVSRLLDRSAREDKHQEYFALVEKQATLRSHRSPSELDESAEFAALERRITELEAELNEEMRSFNDEDYAVAFRDL